MQHRQPLEKWQLSPNPHLVDLGIVRREVPATEHHPEKSRKGVYRIADHFVRFWFRFVLPNRSLLEEGYPEIVLERKIMPHFATFTGPLFEGVCIERPNGLGRLPSVFDRIGRWWGAGEEVDIVAVSPEALALGECKWKRNEKVTMAELPELKRRAAHVRRPAQVRSGTEYYMLFSRSGLTKGVVDEARSNRTLLLFSLDDLLTLATDNIPVARVPVR